MKVTQIASILNSILPEMLGTSDVIAEDLSNLVSIGKTFTDFLDDNSAYDNYIKKLINHIGRVKFVDRVYKGRSPSVLMESWDYGSILEKVDMEMPDSTENSSWGLTDGQTYNQDIFNGPKNVDVQFFNDGVTFEIDMSFAIDKVKQSFSSPEQLNGFMSMIENKIQMRKTVDYDNLVMRTINNFIAATVHTSFEDTSDLSAQTGARAINLLRLYKLQVPNADQTLTPEKCLKSLDFLKFAAYQIMLYSDRIVDVSKLFNIGKRTRFTPKDKQHILMLSEFYRAADVYLQSDTFHNELTRLPKAETVNFWQGTGESYSFEQSSEIHVQILDPADKASKVEVALSGILCTIFDYEALGVNNKEDKVTSHYNAKGDFVNNYYKSFARYFNDYKENFIVFFVA